MYMQLYLLPAWTLNLNSMPKPWAMQLAWVAVPAPLSLRHCQPLLPFSLSAPACAFGYQWPNRSHISLKQRQYAAQAGRAGTEAWAEGIGWSRGGEGGG